MVGTKTQVDRWSQWKHCERCNSWVPVERTRCPNCRAELPLLPDTVPIEVAPDGHMLAEYVNGQLEGVVDQRTRIARLRAITWDLEQSIETGVISFPHQIEQARAFIGAAEQETSQYLATEREANRRAAVTWLWRGLLFLAIGIVLTVVFAVAVGGVEALLIALVAGAIAARVFGIRSCLTIPRPATAPSRTPAARSFAVGGRTRLIAVDLAYAEADPGSSISTGSSVGVADGSGSGTGVAAGLRRLVCSPG